MTTKGAILHVVRQKCLDCSGGRRGEVRACTLIACPLWPFRMGADPEPGHVRGCAKASLARNRSPGAGVGQDRDSLRPAPLRKAALGRSGSARSETIGRRQIVSGAAASDSAPAGGL